MNCQSCRHENRPNARFCSRCGGRLEARCAQCGALTSPGDNFCDTCGTQLTPAALRGLAAPSEPPKPASNALASAGNNVEGERKQVTILFADIVRSTELLADRDPEEARNLLNPVLARMTESAQRFDGTEIEKRGDSILALFGAPLAHEDHGVRGCYAALRMQQEVKGYAEEVLRMHGVPIEIRVGLHSGEVVVTKGADGVMAVDGVVVHLAARMEQLAKAGSILITGATMRLAEGYVHVKPIGRIPVKGLSEPVDSYELTGAQTVRTRLQAAATRGLTRFVGREAELEQLRGAWRKAVAGKGQIVAVLGEAGVGKSRLFYEFAHERPPEAWLVIESGSLSYGKATPYLPIIELLKGYFKIEDRDEHRTIREKVTGKLIALDESLKSELVPILELLDVPVSDPDWKKLEPQQRRQATFDAVKRLLLRESQVQPVAVIFEDLHGIDSETQAVLNSLVDSLSNQQVLLLVNYRPGYEHAWNSRPYYTHLRIDPLSAENVESLLDALLGPDATLTPLKRLLATRTGGNPFFLEESVRALAEVGALSGSPGKYRQTKPLTVAEVHVPSTIQPIIAARIDRLLPAHKQLLQAAAVVGMSVPFALLQAIAELPEQALRQGLAQLQQSEFLYETSLFPEPEYSFKHALTHEVAYTNLLQERKRPLHSRIVQAMETLYAGRLAEHIERLAHHALRGEVWDKALAYYAQGGAKAAAKSVHGEAVTRFENARIALERLPQDPAINQQAFDLCFKLRTSLSALGEFGRSFEELCKAETIAKNGSDEALLARVLSFKALYYWSVGKQSLAIEAAGQALEPARRLGEKPAEMLADLFAARARHARGDYVQAGELLDSVISATEGDRSNYFDMANLPSVSARAWLAWAQAECGDFRQALDRAGEAASIAEAAEDRVSRIYAYMALGIADLRKGELSRALSTLQRAYQWAQDADLHMARATVAGYLGRALTLTGRAADAIEVLEEAIVAAAAMELMVDQAVRLVHLGEAYLHDGQVEQASRVAECALQSATDHEQRGCVAWAHWLLGEVRVREGDLVAAEERYREALAVASGIGMKPLVAHCHLGLGEVRNRCGDPEQARAHVTSAAELYRSLAMSFWMDAAEAALQRLGTAGSLLPS